MREKTGSLARRGLRGGVLTALAILAASACHAAYGQESQDGMFWELHGSVEIDRLVTRAMIEEVCARSEGSCAGITYGGEHYQVNVRAHSPTHLAIRAAIAAREPKVRTVEFKITLIEASTKAIPEDRRWVPEEAATIESEARALRDLRQLLPYRHFAVLDVATISTLDHAQTTLRVPKSAVRYETVLRIRPTSGEPGTVRTDFRMSVDSKEAYGLALGAVVVSNGFTIAPQETVVVGSSKIGDTDAILVLVTYVD